MFEQIKSIEDLNKGSVRDLFEREWAKVIEDISDPSTDAQKKRKIQIEIEITPSQDRASAHITTKAKSTLAGPKGDAGHIFLELTSKGVVASQMKEEIQPELGNLMDFNDKEAIKK